MIILHWESKYLNCAKYNKQTKTNSINNVLIKSNSRRGFGLVSKSNSTTEHPTMKLRKY